MWSSWEKTEIVSQEVGKGVELRNESDLSHPATFLLLVFCPQGPFGERRSRHLQVRRWREAASLGREKD